MLEYRYLIDSLKEHYPLLHDALTKKTGVILMISYDNDKAISYETLNVKDIHCHELRDYLSGFAIVCNYDEGTNGFTPSFQIKLNRKYKHTFYRLFLSYSELYNFLMKHIIDIMTLSNIVQNFKCIDGWMTSHLQEDELKRYLTIIRTNVVELYGTHIEKFKSIGCTENMKVIDDFNDFYANVRSNLYEQYKLLGYNYYEDF